MSVPTNEDLISASEEKQCPYCAETIKAAAVVCRHCGKDLAASNKLEDNKKTKSATETNNMVPGCVVLIVIIIAGILCFMNIGGDKSPKAPPVPKSTEEKRNAVTKPAIETAKTEAQRKFMEFVTNDFWQELSKTPSIYKLLDVEFEFDNLDFVNDRSKKNVMGTFVYFNRPGASNLYYIRASETAVQSIINWFMQEGINPKNNDITIDAIIAVRTNEYSIDSQAISVYSPSTDKIVTFVKGQQVSVKSRSDL